jgi:hypothetical protein
MTVGIAATEANALLTAHTGGTAYSGPSAVWVELRTGDPGASGTANNVAGNATRKQVTWGTASGGVISNSSIIEWSTSEVDTTEDYTHAAFWTAATSGTFLGSAVIVATSVVAGDAFQILAGELQLFMVVATT